MATLSQGDPVRFMDGELPDSGTMTKVFMHLVVVTDMTGDLRLLDKTKVAFDHARQILLQAQT